MNTDIRLSIGFWQHPKTKKTVKRLGLEGIQALQVLWLWVAVHRPDGKLINMDWEDIELASGWQGEEKAFFDFCIGDGNAPMWIDTTSEGEFVLHDWVDHNPWQAEADTRSDSARFARLAQVNKDAFDALKVRGITSISKEMFDILKNMKQSPSECQAFVRQQFGDSPAVATQTPSECQHSPMPQAPAPSPSPSPKPKENKNNKLSTSGKLNRACDYTNSEKQRHVCENSPDSLANPCDENAFPWSEYEDGALPQGQSLQDVKPIKTDSPSKGTPEWSNFLRCYEVYPVQKNQEGAWKAWHELSQRGILDPTAYIRDKILELTANDSQWLAGYAPNMEKWLRSKGWNDKPYIKPEPAKGQVAPVVAKTPEQKAREKQEAEAFIARKQEESRRENAKLLERKRQEASKQKQVVKPNPPPLQRVPPVVQETEAERKEALERQAYLAQQAEAIRQQARA